MKRPDRYATLLRVRKRVEELKANALASAQRDELVAHTRLSEIEHERRDALGRASQLAREPNRVSLIPDLIHYERHLGQVARNQSAEIEKLADEVEARRGELHEAVTQRRKVDRLMERARDSFRDWLKIQDQRATDEAATVRAARTQKRTMESIGRTV